ncbi:MAG: hypothetical protein HQK77_11795 [Desulfobacterales bacterium]|nr:hypothetical protein [Desulfobacterales bacterium]
MYHQCSQLFLQGKWQISHLIQAELPTGKTTFMHGTVIFSAQEKKLESIIMSIEGFVLFNASYEHEKMTVHRAISPLDASGFADGLMHDLQLIFFQPNASSIETGCLPSLECVCRYSSNQGNPIDILIQKDHLWEIREYNKRHRLSRSVKAMSFKTITEYNQLTFRIPDVLVLTTYGLLGYTLNMNLIEAIPIDM